MQQTDKEIERYLVYSPERLGHVLVDDAPEYIREKALEWEKSFYSRTSRRRILNLEIDEENIPFFYEELLKNSEFVPARGAKEKEDE